MLYAHPALEETIFFGSGWMWFALAFTMVIALTTPSSESGVVRSGDRVQSQTEQHDSDTNCSVGMYSCHIDTTM